METLKIGLVGAGGMGSVHFNNYRHIEGCQVVGLVDVPQYSQPRAKEWGVTYYENIREMVEVEKLDLVDVCTPTFLHKAHVMQALEAGANVITEKPIALHLAARGRQVMLLEGAEVGWGASGRNNGQVIPTLSAVEPDARATGVPRSSSSRLKTSLCAGSAESA